MTYNVVPSQERTYYENNIYWNDFPQIRCHINKLISGEESLDWMDWLRLSHHQCETALSLNCGNGWVERDLFRKQIIKRTIGLDINKTLLDQATKEACALNFPSKYEVQNANNMDLSKFKFDWAINHAALHHIAYIDHALRELSIALPEDGLLISYDYIGPHRNQYDGNVWQKLIKLNELAPTNFKIELKYPHLRTMLHVDPTEAVHSELIIPTMERYFQLIESKPLGGAILYPLLYDNRELHLQSETRIGREWLNRLILEDQEFTNGDLSKSLFAYIVARPRKSILTSKSLLSQWSTEEEQREEHARLNAGRYYHPTAFEIIYEKIYQLQDLLKHYG